MGFYVIYSILLMSPIIDVREIKYRYASQLVLNNISFSVQDGEIICIMGPNGSGKTTILKLISKVLRPEAGSIWLMGRDIGSMKHREIAKIIGVVPQGASVAFPFTVREVVLMGRSPHLGLFQIERESDMHIADNAMALTDTLELAHRNIDELSGGEHQRAIIARALAQEPKVLLLDEPTSFLDINHQIEIFDLIKRLNGEKGLTVIIVSHDLNMAAEYCDRILLMKNGQVYIFGSPRETITKEHIREVYDANVAVMDNIVTGAPYIIPLSQFMSKKYHKHNQKIHIICGGGSGAKLMRLLAIEGYQISSGVLNIGDTDYQLAKSLGIEVVEENPFSHIGEPSHLKNIDLIKNANTVILARVPIGMGNLKNMNAARIALDEGKKLIIFDGFEGMDYTDGKATEIFNYLKNKGALVLKSESEIIDVIN